MEGSAAQRVKDQPCGEERIALSLGERDVTVKRKTVIKELGALRALAKWAHERGYLGELPRIENPGLRVLGTPSPRATKTKAIVLAPRQVEAIIGALPEHSPGGGRGGPFPVRARFVVAWETALRPATLDAIRAPDDYQRGGMVLRIRDEADKARFGRDVPLTDRARKALDAVCPDTGLIFGKRDYREYLKEAALAAGLPKDVAARVSPYDFRHSRLTHLAEIAPNLPGLMFLAGHKHGSTTSRYLHAGRRAAEAVLAATGARRFRSDSGRPPLTPRPGFPGQSRWCERGDSNPHGG